MHRHRHTHGKRRSSHGEIERDAHTHINYHYPLSEQIKLHEEWKKRMCLNGNVEESAIKTH